MGIPSKVNHIWYTSVKLKISSRDNKRFSMAQKAYKKAYNIVSCLFRFLSF